jgi:peptide/nickel transport system substrate-binding protein
MKKSRKLKVVTVMAAAAMMTAACASEPDNDGTDNGAAPDNGANDEAAEDGNEAGDGEAEELAEGNDLIIGTLSDISSLDPHTTSDVPSGNVQINLFESLTKFDEDLELQPNLAESWEDVEPDVWEFELREDVTFTDGTEFNAEAVKVNIERLLDPDVASPRVGQFETIEEVEVVDDYTVRFHLENPFAALPAHLSTYPSNMVSPELIEEDYANMEDDGQPGDIINEDPVGTGIFTFNSWEPGDRVVLDANEDYWGENVNVDSVTFNVVPEDLTRIGEMESGAAHIIDPVTPSDMSRLEETDGTNVYQREAASITYMGFNAEKEPFGDERVRSAIDLALNKENMQEGVLEGTGEPANGPINSTQFGYSENIEPTAQDLEEAQSLLEEAGYEDGFETTLWTNDSRERMDIAELAQADLAQIGVDVTIEVLEWGAYLDATAEGEHDMFILGLSLPTMDADYPLHELFHSDSVGEGNRFFYADTDYDEIIQQARIEEDEDARLSLYEDAVNHLNATSPASFLYHPDHIMGHRDEISGFWADGSGLYQLQDVEIEQ